MTTRIQAPQGRASRFFGLLAVTGALFATVAAVPHATTAPPQPEITSGPSGSTSSTSATFTYTNKKPDVTFHCSLDSAAFAPCPSTGITYTALAEGPHLFKVAAKFSDSALGNEATRSWRVDTITPTVSSINRTGSSPTNATSVSWSVVFSEAVGGVNASDFVLVRTGLTGSTAITSVSGSLSSYVVTGSTGGGVGTLRVDLADNDSIVDAAGHKLGGTGAGNGNFTGQTYSIDRIAPPAPVITEKPQDPNPFAEVTFEWTDTEGGVSFQCLIDEGAWHACSSPYEVTVNDNNNEQHQFSVRAVDAAGNLSPVASYSWKLAQIKFDIVGRVVDAGSNDAQLYPGTWRFIEITVTNPNSFDLDVNSLTVSATSSPAGCDEATNLEFVQSPLSNAHKVAVPRHATVTFALADGPQIRLKNLPVVQDDCKNQTFDLAYVGTATK